MLQTSKYFAASAGSNGMCCIARLLAESCYRQDSRPIPSYCKNHNDSNNNNISLSVHQFINSSLVPRAAIVLTFDLLTILEKSLDRALFLYTFIHEIRSSGVRAFITIVHIRKFYKISFDSDSLSNNYEYVISLVVAASRSASLFDIFVRILSFREIRPSIME